MQKLTLAQKRTQAEKFVELHNDYTTFHAEFVNTFDLNSVQCIALHHLCQLAEKYGAAIAQVESTHELFNMYYSEDNSEVEA